MAKLYRLSMIEVDNAVGMVVQALEERGLLDKTMIIFTSDHGDFAGEHGLMGKSRFPIHSIFHVPLIVRSAGRDRGETVGVPCSGYDLFPTLMEAAGIDCAKGDRDGCSLFSHDFSSRQFVNLYTWDLAQLHVTSYVSLTWRSKNRQQANGTSRYTRGLHSGKEDLFDLASDPFECVNVADATQAQQLRDLARERTRDADDLAAGYDATAHSRRWSKW